MSNDDVNFIMESIRSSELSPIDKTDKKCAPSKTFSGGTCIELDVLVDLVKAYNEEETLDGKQNNVIKLSNKLDTLNPEKYKKYLVKNLKTRLDDICDNQSCWMKQKFVKRMKNEAKHQLKKNTLLPKGPNGKLTWLDTFNINDVMAQYEFKYKDYKFLGAVPVDFDDLPQLGIKNLSFDDLKKEGKTKIGIIFNLDEHYKNGSHWVASYIDLEKGDVHYFDSYGTRPEPRISAFLNRSEKYLKQKCGKTNVGYNKNVCQTKNTFNKVRHQYKGSECGVYSINFILRSLKGETFKQITENKTPDDVINKCRDKYFINGRKKYNTNDY